MSLLGHEINVNGLRCAMVSRRATGQYALRFEREFASLEQLESIPWGNPTIEVVSPLGTTLPTGCGFELQDITLEYSCSCWVVTVALGTQYYGDVSSYVEQINTLEAQQDVLEEQLAAAQADVAAAQGNAAEAQATATQAQEILSIILEGEDDEA